MGHNVCFKIVIWKNYLKIISKLSLVCLLIWSTSGASVAQWLQFRSCWRWKSLHFTWHFITIVWLKYCLGGWEIASVIVSRLLCVIAIQSNNIIYGFGWIFLLYKLHCWIIMLPMFRLCFEFFFVKWQRFVYSKSNLSKALFSVFYIKSWHIVFRL